MTEHSRSTIVVWALAAVLAVVAGARLLGGYDAAPPAPVKLASGGAEHDDAGINVHVVGAVRRPGLLKLPSGSRVADALERAGGPGPHADLAAVNLAARLGDGQQIVVPAADAPAAGGPAGGLPAGSAPGGASGSAGPPNAAAPPGGAATGIHLSTATVEQLDGVDGIGPTLAQRIIEYRDAHGGFRSLTELAQVDGIGEERLATLREALQL